MFDVFKQDLLPINHIAFLEKHCSMFKPKVAYDIGSAVLHWSRHIKRIHPECKVIHFDANPDFKVLYDREKIEEIIYENTRIGILHCRIDHAKNIVKFRIFC